MNTVRTIARTALATAAVAGICAATVQPARAATQPATATTAVAAASVTTSRLAGSDRYGTAAAISRHQFPNGAKSVYLVSSTAYADAVSAGMLADGPILLVPATGAVPASISAEIRRLAPSTVYAIGSTLTVSQQTLTAAAQGRATGRLAGANRYETAVAISRRAMPTPPSGDSAALVVNSTPTADSIVAGSVASPTLAVLPVPATGAAPAVIRAEVARTAGGYVAAVGGPTTVSDVTLTSAAGGYRTGRVAGRDRYATSVELARYRWAGQAPKTVYLANGQVWADALASGSLTAGPVLLVPKSGPIPTVVADYVRSLAPTQVIALGGTPSVSDATLTAVKNAAGGRMPTTDVYLQNPYSAKDVLRPGWTVTKQAAATGELTCEGPSISAAVPNTHRCGITAQSAHDCYVKPGYGNVVTCIVDPRTKTLLEYRVSGTLGTTEATLPDGRLPLAVEMANKDLCLIRNGGAWPHRDADDLDPWAGCTTDMNSYLWAPSDGDPSSVSRLDGATWQFRYGKADPATPVTWQDARVRYFLG